MLSMLLIGAALAQDGAPVVALEALSLPSDSGCTELPEAQVPRVLRTTRGLALLREEGAYTFGCASDFGGDPDAPAASSPDGRELLVAGDGGVWYSANAGCNPVPIDVGAGEPVDALYWRQAFWVIQRDFGAGESRLLRIDAGTPTTVLTWTDFHPDGMAPEDTEYLWLAGVTPSVQVRRVGFLGGLTGDVPLLPLPEDIRDVEHVEPRGGRNGEAWLVVSRRQSEWTWFGEELPNGEVRIRDTGERPRTVLGPAWYQGRWMAAFDLMLQTSQVGDGGWTPSGDRVSWTCLQDVGEHTFACTVEAFLSLTGALPPTETEVFRAVQLAGPEPACAPSVTCDDDWADVVAMEALDPENQAVCPDGRTLEDLEGPACTCRHAQTPWWAVLLVPWLHRRRSRRGR